MHYLVFGDLHTQTTMLKQSLEGKDLLGTRIVCVGDIVDGGESTADIIEYLISIQAVVVLGNHEWVLRNAIETPSSHAGWPWRNTIWPKFHKNVLQSYSIKPQPSWDANALALHSAMKERGHLQWLCDMPPYWLTEDFLVVHAGLVGRNSLDDELAYLRLTNTPDRRLFSEPAQIFDEDFVLSEPDGSSCKEPEKLVITGHSHLSCSASERWVGNRIFLASRLNKGQPMYFFDSQTWQVVEFCRE